MCGGFEPGMRALLCSENGMEVLRRMGWVKQEKQRWAGGAWWWARHERASFRREGQTPAIPAFAPRRRPLHATPLAQEEGMADKRTMAAVQYHGYGGGAAGLQHVELKIPAPKKGELLVKVEVAGINPVDWKIQKGQLRPFLPAKFPYVPGCDIAGEVVSIGSDVASFDIGDKVVSWLHIWRGGAFAEYVVTSVKYTAKLPAKVSVIDGACLPTAGLTALQAIRDYAKIKLDGNSNSNVLITAASGGVGHFAVQIAKIGGAHVTATCGARNMQLMKELGADEVLDYKTPEGASLESPSGRKYDAIINCVAGIPWSTFEPHLIPAGKVIDVSPKLRSIVTWVVQKLTFSKQSLAMVAMIPRQRDLQLLVELVKDGKLKCLVDSRHLLAQAADAWNKSLEGHATGKVMIITEEQSVQP